MTTQDPGGPPTRQADHGETAFRIRSASSETVLTFQPPEGEFVVVSVSGHAHAGRKRVSFYAEEEGIPRLLAEAAEAWRGWEGTKRWESLEGDLALELTTDREGHVTLRVELRDYGGRSDAWALDAELSLEAGQLETLARRATRHFEGLDRPGFGGPPQPSE